MLVIGHRGAAGIAPENTLESLQAGIDSGADMLEFDVRITSDAVPILYHDAHLSRSRRRSVQISRLSLAQVRQKTRKHPVITLEEALDLTFGKIMLNIEIKSRSAVEPVMRLIESKYIKQPEDWNNILFSSFQVSALRAIRQTSRLTNLSLLHSQNPFIFVAYARSLELSAVGFHRLYVNPLALAIAKKSGLFTYAYTVDRPQAAILLAEAGLDGVVSDHPDRILARLEHYSSHGD